MRTLVANKQLEFVNGGASMNDEGATHYTDMIDQMTWGHQFLLREFGPDAVPSIGWQIDPVCVVVGKTVDIHLICVYLIILFHFFLTVCFFINRITVRALGRTGKLICHDEF